jgi:protein-tyrosine phosphatase
MKSILFVCLGNICRSPMAEAICREVIQSRGLSEFFQVDSAGTAGYHIGKSPDPRTLKVLAAHGLETAHLGQKLSVSMLDTFDHIVVMDSENFEFVHNLYHQTFHRPPAPQKVFLMRDHDPLTRGAQEVPDPYYENEKAFEEVYQMLYRSCDHMITYLLEWHGFTPTET